MRLVLDASVAVAAARTKEPAHRVARRRATGILEGKDEIVVPTLFAIEVAAALARAGESLAVIRAYVDALLGAAVSVVPLGPRAARHVRETAMRWQLRGADAVYVWVAQREGIPLCTLDRELAERAAPVCAVIGP